MYVITIRHIPYNNYKNKYYNYNNQQQLIHFFIFSYQYHV
jgi:hypothetical protein